MNSQEREPKAGGQPFQQNLSISDSAAVRNTIQQIGQINIGSMSQEQFKAIMEQLGQVLQRLGVPTQISAEGATKPLSPQAQQVAQAVVEKVEEAERRFGTTVGDPVAYLELGNVAFNGKNYSEALSYYEQALTLNPKYANARNNRGVALHKLERHEEAIASYDKAIAIKPD